MVTRSGLRQTALAKILFAPSPPRSVCTIFYGGVDSQTCFPKSIFQSSSPQTTAFACVVPAVCNLAVW